MSANQKKPELQITQEFLDDKRRTLRLKKSAILQLKLDNIDRPSINIAENIDEYKQAFNITYEEYVRKGYADENKEFPYCYSQYSLLPETCVYVFKTYKTVIATLTEIFDTPEFGLPMDTLYKRELDALRDQGRRIVELSQLVTSRRYRMKNIMITLCKMMFNYSRLSNVDDICIMVNPNHVRFYRQIFLFQTYGEKHYYNKVHAYAVPLRINMRTIENDLYDKYSHLAFDEDLYRYFCRINREQNELYAGNINYKKASTPKEVLDFFAPRLAP